MNEGYRLPADTSSYKSQKAAGFTTPVQDVAPQVATFLPKRVLPVIFLPGIMGSNLRITDPARVKELKQKDNIAWRPDDLGISNVGGTSRANARIRQLRLDPSTTAVDIYDPDGPSDVTGDVRNKNVTLGDRFSSPLLASDPQTHDKPRTAAQKARMRGWGEVFYGSYGAMLQLLESRLNNTFSKGKLQTDWHDVIGVDPVRWRADASLPQKALAEDELKKVATGCWFPVYAFGYNWLQSNGDTAKVIANRITAVIDTFTKAGFECPKVIVVTHSMGGLVARALIHPDFGNLKDKVLGMVHGEQPSIGAGAGYKRIRAGFDDPGITHPEDSIVSKVAGNMGDEVTAVLANSPGGLQLLPSQAYGNGWLQVQLKGQTLDAWPKQSDPYEEIYKVKGKWWSLIREEWINPGHRSPLESSWGKTMEKLDKAKIFHAKISDTYHECSYAHYGADPKFKCHGDVIWDISKNCEKSAGWKDWPILSDTRQGRLEVVRTDSEAEMTVADGGVPMTMPTSTYATILPGTESGDQTVPIRSSDHQLRSGKFKGVFRQTGYEHQGSYQDPNVLAATLYCIVRIAQQAHWKDA